MGATPAVRTRGAAIAVSAVAHALVLGLLLWRLGTAPQLAEPPVMQVQILTRSLPRPARPERPPAEAKTPPGAAVLPPVLSRPAKAAPSADPAVPAPSADGQPALRQALRGLVGCEHARLAGLTPEERDGCRERLAAGLKGAPARFNLDPSGRYLTDPTPYLNRRPTHGCQVRAAGDKGPEGQEGLAAGFLCAWAF